MGILDVFEKVVKADDSAGAAFIDAVIYDYLSDQASAVRKDLVGVISLASMDRIQLAKRQLGQQYVATMVDGHYPNQETFGKHAEWLSGLETYVTAVSKDLEWMTFMGGRREQRDVERDARGRFARKSNSSPVKLDQRAAEYDRGSKRMAPAVRSSIDAHGGLQQMMSQDNETARTEAERIQGDYEAVSRVAGDFKRALKGADAKEVEVEVMFLEGDPNNPDVVSRRFTLDQFQNGELPDGLDFGTGRKPFAMQVQSKRGASDRTQRVVGAYNLMGEQGGAALASLAGVDDDRLNALTQSLGMDTTPDASGLTRFFNQLRAGGNVLAQVSGQEKLGEAVAFVGSVGPQAEKVLGPYAQRTAYRYRGTETSPSQELMSQMKEVNSPKVAQTLYAGDGTQITPTDPVTSMARGVGGMLLDKDSAVMQARGDVASATLAQTLPKDPMTARLSELSGQVLPSQGVLIDADGKVVSQSVGVIDDHYLPFDLMNLNDLNGGQYARTRMSGGLTGEDILTSAFYGARQAQVVSPSGVFTLEFAPSFRGGRSFMRAKEMQDRYLKILDAVDNSDQYLLDISPTEKQRIKNEVRDMGFTGEEAKVAEEERIDAARRSQSQLTAEDEEMARTKVMSDMGLTDERQITANGQTARAFEEQYSDEIDRIRSLKANKLRLNGEGYHMALQTLQQQFPYFIERVSYRSLNDFARVANLQGTTPKGRMYASDSGYAKPGSLRAQSVRSGFYERGPLQPPPKRLPGERGRAQAAAETAAAATPVAAEIAPPAGGTEQESAAAPAAPVAPVAPDAKVGVSTRLNAKSKVLEETMAQAYNNLAGQIGAAGFDNPNLDGMSTDIAMSQSSNVAAAWLLTRDPKTLASLFANRDAGFHVASILSDRNAVEEGLGMVAFGTSADGRDFWAKGGKIGDQDVPAGDLEASLDWVQRTAQTAADAFLMQHPFVQGSDPMHGAKGNAIVPQANPQMAAISNVKQLQDFASGHPDMWEDARSLMLRNGSSYRSLGEIGLSAQAKAKNLAKLAEFQQSLPADAKNSDVIDRAGSKEKLVAMLSTFSDPAEVETAVDEANDAGPDGLVALARSVKVPDEGRRLQNAWSLAMTTRIVEALDRGDVLPFGDRRLAKSAPRVEVLGPDHPLSVAVAERVAKGLPFVPYRTGRRLTIRV